MNQRKLLLAALRNGDYAHAGEEEAIDLTMNLIQKKSKQRLLDVGCGLGGTANYIEKNGWGKVSAIDIDPQMINHTKQYYPHIESMLGDASEVDSIFHDHNFDLIYSFNAFFCFPQQAKTLKALSRVAHFDTQLLIFDYSSPQQFNLESPFKSSKVNAPSNFLPINVEQIQYLLADNGWRLEQWLDLSSKYISWYGWLLQRMNQEKAQLKAQFGENTFDDLYDGYQKLLDLIKQGELGGGVLLAKM